MMTSLYMEDPELLLFTIKQIAEEGGPVHVMEVKVDKEEKSAKIGDFLAHEPEIGGEG
jgi:hypothetical protein